jgi:hypothetical protein
MPRINDQLLESVIYLYPSVEAANKGISAGGTGFLVGVTSEKDVDRIYVYAVTNSHVIREGKSTVIRLNTQKRDIATATLAPDDWIHHIDGDDVAVAGLSGNFDALKIKCISSQMFLSKEIVAKHNIGPGDETFMCGRFVSHDGKQQNTPSVRFGNISMMPLEAVIHPRGHEQESFLVETRSLSGYSGSPVFVYLEHATARPFEEAIPLVRGEVGPWLLGIDWAHMSTYEKVKEKDRITDTSQGYIVGSNTGQMAVVPAWKLYDLLYDERLVASRKQLDIHINPNS